EASAPGKIILFGEHFVVKGYRAIATSTSLRARVSVEEAGEPGIVIESENFNIKGYLNLNLEGNVPRELLVYVEILRALRERGFSLIPHRARVKSHMPISAGLGSSASTSVAYALAYTALHGDPLKGRDLLEVSLEGEKVAHGRPSGIDNTIAALGGTIVYRRGEEPLKVEANIPGGYAFLIVDTGVKRSTRDAVEYALRVAESFWEIASLIYEAADRIVGEALKALKTGDMKTLGSLMYVNHGLLNAIGVSHGKLDAIVDEARKHGALGAKLTGAGWGGCAIILAAETAVGDLAEKISRHAVSVEKAKINVEGATIDYSSL
ncbi:MAG: mevalonate kinase, partial [Acidilobaceae archaeon]